MEKGKVKKIVLPIIIGVIATFIAFYLWLPSINLRDPSFWVFLAFSAVMFALSFAIFGRDKDMPFFSKTKTKTKKSKDEKTEKPLGFKVCIIIAVSLIAVMLLGVLISSEIFNARKYASVISINEAVFSEDMPETTEIKNIALMDSESAQIIGNRALDKLADVVSQFVAGEDYIQINYKGYPKKVTSLEYADIFKWASNRESGIPGYIMVDPVNNNAEYVRLERAIRYTESGYFSDDLVRCLRFKYPTKIFDYISFEIDEQGNPYYVVSCATPHIFPFGARDIDEVIIFDPCTGESNIYSVGDIPSWVDTVYSGDLAMEKYNWHGTLSGGFINSIIGNKGCKETTDDFGYIAIGDDVWYFTGVTSVTADSSNIGFILTNARTGEYKYYAVGGAEEHSAMNAAEGEVQEKGYVASFPSLVNISGEATYIMVLKDASGIVKLYALVNVENYNIVATGQTQDEVMRVYKNLLVQKGEISEPEGDRLECTVTALYIRDIVISSNTVLYIECDDGYIYKGTVADSEELVTVREGQRLKIEYELTDTEGIRKIASFEIIPQGD